MLGIKKQKIGQIIHEKKLKSSEIQKILFDGIIINTHGFKHLERMGSWWVMGSQQCLLQWVPEIKMIQGIREHMRKH